MVVQVNSVEDSLDDVLFDLAEDLELLQDSDIVLPKVGQDHLVVGTIMAMWL